MSKHTPGPWTTRESATHVTVTNARGDAVFHDDKRIPGVMVDARLIASAPELLEACLAMIEWDDRENDHAVNFQKRMELCALSFQKARAAIAKATGEQV